MDIDKYGYAHSDDTPSDLAAADQMAREIKLAFRHNVKNHLPMFSEHQRNVALATIDKLDDYELSSLITASAIINEMILDDEGRLRDAE